MKKCPFCSEEIQDEAIKCKHCGEILQETPPIEDAEPDTSSPVIGRKRPVLSYICATIGSILFFMFAIVAFAGGRSTEGKVSLGLAIAFFLLLRLYGRWVIYSEILLIPIGFSLRALWIWRKRSFSG